MPHVTKLTVVQLSHEYHRYTRVFVNKLHNNLRHERIACSLPFRFVVFIERRLETIECSIPVWQCGLAAVLPRRESEANQCTGGRGNEGNTRIAYFVWCVCVWTKI